MTSPEPRRLLRFGQFEADLHSAELRRAGLLVKIQAQPFAVLALLLQRPGEIVTRDEIVHHLWHGETFVDFEQSVAAVLRKLRHALGDSATQPRYIETLRNRGYRFLLPVHPADAPPAPQPAESGRPALRSTALVLLTLLLASMPRHLPAVGTLSAHSDAWIACQKGRFLWKARTAEAITQSIEYFQSAVQLDPAYAPAHAGLADAYVLRNLYTGGNRHDAVQLALAASRRALQLDPSLPDPHATQAFVKFYYEWDWPAAEAGFQKAIALNPAYATAHQWYAELLFYQKRFPEALREIHRAHELDPQSVLISNQLASPLLYAGHYTQAIDKIHEALRLNPDFPMGIYMLATCYEQLGQFDDALRQYERIAGTRAGLAGLGYIYARTGRQAEARQVIQKLTTDTNPGGLSPYHLAWVYAALGESEEAFSWLNKARDAHDERIMMVKVDPKLNAIRADPRFHTLLRNLRLA